MSMVLSPPLQPRKSPVQGRALATLEAILEATIQVLLADGIDRMTTTRVAERAGVSVGSMYQYFPNKQALLFALVERRLDEIVDALRQGVAELLGKPLREMSDGLVDAWFAAKAAGGDRDRALYMLFGRFDVSEMISVRGRQMVAAVEEVLENVPDAQIADPATSALTVMSILGGSLRQIREWGASDAELEAFRGELRLACRAYLDCVASPPA